MALLVAPVTAVVATVATDQEALGTRVDMELVGQADWPAAATPVAALTAQLAVAKDLTGVIPVTEVTFLMLFPYADDCYIERDTSHWDPGNPDSNNKAITKERHSSHTITPSTLIVGELWPNIASTRCKAGILEAAERKDESNARLAPICEPGFFSEFQAPGSFSQN